MKIRNIITSFRTRRARRLTLSDSVSFEDFCNEAPSDRFPRLKESSLNDSFDISPIKLSVSIQHNTMQYNHTLTYFQPSNYKRFAREPEIELNNSSRPSLATVLLFIVLSAVFLILPIIYLLNCFDIIYEHQHLKHNPIVQPSGVSCV